LKGNEIERKQSKIIRNDEKSFSHLFVYCIANFDLGLYYDSISLRTNPDGMAQPDLSMDISWYLSHSSRYSDGETPVLRLKMVEK